MVARQLVAGVDLLASAGSGSGAVEGAVGAFIPRKAAICIPPGPYLGPGLPLRDARRSRRLGTAMMASDCYVVVDLRGGSVPIGKAEDVGLSTERLKRIGEAVQRHIAAGNVAGAVTLVARRGKIAHFEAQGVMDVDTKKPMAKDNLFRLASMSKPITGVAVMMLVEEGKIRLNDPVSRFIPSSPI